MSDAIKKIEEAKGELEKIKQVNNNIDIESIFDIVKSTQNNIATPKSRKSDHIPINTLEIIREKLNSTKQVNGTNVPAYSEEDKVKIIFGLLAEKGMNLLDNLEKILERDGYKYGNGMDGGFEEGSSKLVDNINDTFDKTTNLLKEISEMQYKKSELELKKENLRIQQYKAELKEKELQIKEKRISQTTGSSGNTNIIAVSSQAELMQILKSQQKELDTSIEIEAEVKGNEHGNDKK